MNINDVIKLLASATYWERMLFHAAIDGCSIYYTSFHGPNRQQDAEDFRSELVGKGWNVTLEENQTWIEAKVRLK